MTNEHLRYQYLLVDWDGTVQHTLKEWLDATIAQLMARGIICDPKTVAQHLVPDLDSCHLYGVTDTSLFIENVIAQAIPKLAGSEVHQDLWDLLVELKNTGIQSMIVSTASKKAIDRALLHHHTRIQFHTDIITPDIEELRTKKKPDPAPFLYALTQLKSHPEQALIIGDSPSDLKGGKNAGIDTVWWYPPENEEYYDHQSMSELNPTYIARTIGELREILFMVR